MTDPHVWTGVLAGAGISAACLVVWGIAAAVGRRGNAKRFVAAHFGGMTTRLVLALALTAWAMTRLEMHLGAFLAALLGSYTLFMIAEVTWLARQRRRLAAGPRAAGGSGAAR